MNAIRLARIRAGLSQAELSRKSGVSQNTISSLETGQHTPRGKTIGKLARALDVDPRDLLGEGAPDPKVDTPTSHELTLDWMLGADNQDRHTALQSATAEERAQLVDGIDAELARLEQRHAEATTRAELEDIEKRAGRVGMMRALVRLGPAAHPVRVRETV